MNGGDVILQAGTPSRGLGGDVTIHAGSGAGTGFGGNVTITAGGGERGMIWAEVHEIEKEKAKKQVARTAPTGLWP